MITINYYISILIFFIITLSDYLISDIKLDFDLDPEVTIVTATSSISTSLSQSSLADLTLDGEELELVSVFINDQELSNDKFKLEEGKLVIFSSRYVIYILLQTKILTIIKYSIYEF